MKKIGMVLLAIWLCVGLAAGASAASGVVGECAWNLDEASGLLTISGSGAIPANAFVGRTEVTSVVIEDGITGIGDYAFSGCTQLESVIIKGNLSAIASSAFARCSSLAIIEYWGTTVPLGRLPSGITVKVLKEGYSGDNFGGLKIETCLGDGPSHVCSDNLTTMEAKAATCIKNGNSEYYTCSCGKYYQDADAKKEISENSWVLEDADAHDWYDPTYTQQDGKHVAHYVCRRDRKHTKQDDPADHVYSTADYICVCQKVQQFTITFDTDGGSEILPITQEYGSNVITPEKPTKEGYMFVGWNVEIPTMMPARDLTIKAVWERIPVSDLPKTGDDSRLSLWMMLMSLAGATLLMLRRREN